MTRIVWGSLTALLASAGTLLAQAPGGLQQAVTLGRPIAVDAAPGGLIPVAAFGLGTPTPAETRSNQPIYRAQGDLGPALPPPPPPEGVLLAPAPAPSSEEPRIWGSIEYLLWWVKDGPLPVVQMDNSLDYGALSGARLTLGGWFNAGRTIGMEGSAFMLAQRSDDLFARAFSPAVPGTPVGASSARANLSSSSQLWGLEVNGLFNLTRTEKFHVDVLGGFRYLDLAEDLDADAAAQTTIAGVPYSASADVGVDTRNHFYGGQAGVKAGFRIGKFYTDFTGKLALGGMQQTIDFAGTAAARAGGLAIRTPILGRQSRCEFAAIPEFQVQVGYDFNRYLRAFVGYDLLYVSNVVRPGDQFEFTSQRGTDFWAQGINFGLEVRY